MCDVIYEAGELNEGDILDSTDKLSNAEFVQMLKMIKRYVNTEMDQWELWKFDTSFSKIYINISMEPSHPGTEDAYTDVTHLLEKQ